MYKVERNEDGSVKRSIRNKASMNYFQYLRYIGGPRIGSVYLESIEEAVPFFINTFYLILFPITMPLFTFIHWRNAKKELKRFENKK